MNQIREVASTVGETVAGGARWAYRNIMSPIIPDFVEERLGLRENINAINEASMPQRAGLFGEVLESVAYRVAPDTSELYSVLINILSNPRESWTFENEFEFMTGVLGLMPDGMQKMILKVTFVPLLRTVGLDNIADLAENDPDEFINKLRRHEADFGAIYTAIRNFGLLPEGNSR